MWRVYLCSALIACAAGSLSAIATVLLLSAAGAGPRDDYLVLERETDGRHDEVVVYYKEAFAAPPYLTGTGFVHYRIVEQKADSFKLGRSRRTRPACRCGGRRRGSGGGRNARPGSCGHPG